MPKDPSRRQVVAASWSLPWESMRGVSATFELPWESEGPVALAVAVVLTANGIAVPPPRPDPGYHLAPEVGDVLAIGMTLTALCVAVQMAVEWNARSRPAVPTECL